MSKLFLDGSKLIHHLHEVKQWQEKKDFAPIHVEISPTNACNYRCKFCYADFTGHKNTKISKEILMKLMKDFGDMGVKSCLFAGDGEPVLVDYVKDAIQKAKSAGVDVALNSNGALFDEDWAHQTLPYLTWLRFSVMAANETTYASIHGTKESNLKKTLKNIEYAANLKKKNGYNVTIGIQQVLLPENASDVLKLAKISKDIGVDYFVLKPFSMHESNDSSQKPISAIQLRDDYMDELKNAEALSDKNFTAIIRWNTFLDDGIRSYDRCLGLPFISQIAADSKVYTCCPFFYNDKFLYGDLTRQSFPEIWHSDNAKKIRNNIEQHLDVHKDCMSYCRHHQINIMLWKFANPPAHINFI